MPRLRAKKDTNQTEIVDALRGVGASVAITHQLGKGFPDIVVGFRGVNYMFEIKDGKKPPSARKLTPDEIEWNHSWRGAVHIVESTEQALSIIFKKEMN